MNLHEKRLGYGKVLKDMPEADYNFFGPQSHKFAEDFVYEEKDIKKLIGDIMDWLNKDNRCHCEICTGDFIRQEVGDALCTKDDEVKR